MERKLTLTLTVDDGRVSALDVQLPRFDAMALLKQRQASEALTLLPSVFSICAQAQATAAAGAIAAASGQPLPAAWVAGHTLAIKIESVQESLRSLCLAQPMQKQKIDTALIADFSQAWRDGTAFLARLQKMLRDHVCDEKALAALTREVKPIAQAWDHFCARHVYGVSVLNWQGETNSAADETLPVMRWFRRMAEDAPTLGRAALSPLPLTMFRSGKLSWQALVQSPYDASAWWRVQQDSRMVPVASRLGNSMAARLWARFVDVAATLAGLLEAEKTKASKVLMLNAAESNASSNAKKSKEEAKQEEKPWFRFHSLGDGIGMAEIECARGVLVHRAQLEGQNVVAYEVCAPTDWNLRRDGALSTLIGWPAADVERLRAQAIWLVQALDPCVAFDIEVAHA